MGKTIPFFLLDIYNLFIGNRRHGREDLDRVVVVKNATRLIVLGLLRLLVDSFSFNSRIERYLLSTRTR